MPPRRRLGSGSCWRPSGVACLLAWSGSAVRVSNPTGNGLEVAGNILSGIFHPSAKLLFTLGTDGVPYLLLETFCIAFLGTIVGAVISLPLSFLSASNLVPKGVALVGRVLIAAIRTIPAFVYGLMFIRVTGSGTVCGPAHDVPVLDRHGIQDVHREH